MLPSLRAVHDDVVMHQEKAQAQRAALQKMRLECEDWLKEATLFAEYPASMQRAAELEREQLAAFERKFVAEEELAMKIAAKDSMQRMRAAGLKSPENVTSAKAQETRARQDFREARTEARRLRSELLLLLRPFPEEVQRRARLIEQEPLFEGTSIPSRSEHEYANLREESFPGRHPALRGEVDGQEVFLKRFDVDDIGLRHEMQARRALPSHPTILWPTGFMRRGGLRYLELPFCSGGNMLEYVSKLRSAGGAEESVVNDRVRMLVQQAVIGLSYLHEHRVGMELPLNLLPSDTRRP
jgi:serine/threonine protein kinase